MSAPAWTPGPWSVHRSRRDTFMCVSAPTITGGGSVCTFPFAGSDNRDANARLIAAAPDLAEAAASLIEAWDARTTGAQQIITGKSDAELQKQAMAAIDGLRAALAKAHGQ